jgi:predicted O-methyltransferase YrrM
VLRLLAASLRAQAVVEIGAGAGVTGLWLLAGMSPDGVLTTVEPEPELQGAAREAFTEAGLRPRVRPITGSPHEVLPRLADASYDMVVVDGDPLEVAGHAEEALRLLRLGGVLAVPHALSNDRVPDPARRDEVTTAMRAMSRGLRSDERVHLAVVTSGDGLLLATRRQV